MNKAFTLLLIFQSFLITAQNWEQVQSVPDNYRTDHSYAFSIGDTGYMVSGNTAAGPTADFYSYDPISDQWSKKDNFPGLARGFAIGDVIDGKAYFGFGNSGSANLNDFWEYDPTTDTWTELAACDCPARTHPAIVALNGFVYVGLGGGGGNKKDWWAYDIENDSWEQKADFPAAERHHPYQFHDDEYVYVGNGHGNGFISNEWYRYDTAEDSWEQVATLPSEGRVAGSQLSHKGYGYVLSGDGDNHSYMETGELWRYDSGIDDWIQLPSHPGRSRWAPASFIINDEMYIINGWNSVDGFFDEIFKLNLTVFSEARLRVVMPDAEDLIFTYDAENCDSFAEAEIEVNTPLVFDTDASLTLSIDPTSTAVAGRDYIFNDTQGTLAAGELMTTFNLRILNDKIASGDKTLIVNLESDQIVESGQSSLLLKEDDLAFDTSVSFGSAQVGIGNTSNPNVFGQYYTNMITQSIYRRSILEESELDAGVISQISIEVEEKGSTLPYLNFTVYMANTSADALDSGINQTINFQEVYRGTLVTSVGTNEIFFDTPFEYDGTSNLAIQYCFDNNDYTNDDFVSAFDVNYNSTATLKIDNVSGCPNAGNDFSTTSLPVITFGEGAASQLYSSNIPISSTISANEEAFMSKNDSILLSLSAGAANMDECIFGSLLSNTNEIIVTNDLVWQDKIYFLENEMDANTYDVTLILPNTGDIDWSSSDLTGLYTQDVVSSGDTPEWESLIVTKVIENEPYVFVTMSYAGSGSYVVGVANVNTSTLDIDSELIYDSIEYHDIMGRKLIIDESDTINNTIGLYIKSYIYQGKVVKTKKIVR